MAVKLPPVPAVPKDASPDLARFLTALKEIIETREGDRANGTYRFVTVEDAIKLNSNSSAGRTGPFGTGTSGGTPISAPSNLQITPTIYYHVLTWKNCLDSHLSHVEVWWNTTNDVSTSTLLAVVTKPITEFHSLAGTDYQDRYYWIRSVSYDGAYSPWVPSTLQGGMLVPGKETVGESVEKIMDTLLGGTPPNYDSQVVYAVGDIVLFSGRRWKRKDYMTTVSDVDPTNSMYWERMGILMEGDIDGVSTVGIDGNLAVDGSILARHIAADQIDGTHINAQAAITLDEGGKATFGNDNIIIDTDPAGGGGNIIVAPDGGPTGNDHVVLSGDNILFNYYDADTLEHIPYSTLKRFEMGTADNGATVLIPGIWKQQPFIIVSPSNLPIYNTSYTSQNQRVVLKAENIRNQSGYDERWQFDACAYLTLTSGAIGVTVNDITTYAGPSSSPPNQLSNVVAPASPDQITEIYINAATLKYHKYVYSTEAGGDWKIYTKMYTGLSFLRLHYKLYGGSYTTVDSPVFHTTNQYATYTFHLSGLPGLAEFYVESIYVSYPSTVCFSTTYVVHTNSVPSTYTYYLSNNLISYETNLGQSQQGIDQGSLNWFAFGT